VSTEIESQLNKIPIVRWVVQLLIRLKLPGFSGYSLYDFLETYVVGIIKGTFSSRASSIAFSFFMAIFPFLLFVLNLIPYLKVENFQLRFLQFIDEMLPPQTHDFFYPVIEDIALNPRKGLLSFTALLTLYLAANGVNAIFSAFEYSYYININRGFFRQYVVSAGVAIFIAVLLIITVGAILYGEYFISTLKRNEYISDDIIWVNVMQFVIFFFMLYTIIATLYHYGIKKGTRVRFFSIGAVVTTLLIILTTYLFGVYINNFSQYNELYGSIGALLIMMFYIWINSNLLLLGFELNATLRRLRDTMNTKE